MEPLITWRTDISERKTVCHYCGFLHASHHKQCVRCHQTLHQRIPMSLTLTWSYLLAAALFLIPANLLPMMVVTTLGQEEGSTIFEGVIYFLDHQDFALAAIIFIASMVIPMFKIAALSYLLMIVHFKQYSKAKQGLKLYRFVHYIGKWSMLDIFVVGIMVSIVQFQSVASINTGGAAIAFCLAVVFTMMAAEKFDPRLMWDNR
jgi:paraquat-inducible protein A